jgi:hypothetical protein
MQVVVSQWLNGGESIISTAQSVDLSYSIWSRKQGYSTNNTHYGLDYGPNEACKGHSVAELYATTRKWHEHLFL